MRVRLVPHAQRGPRRAARPPVHARLPRRARHRARHTRHADGTGRLQTVFVDTNPRYHALIKAFEKRTGVPIVLNTSFNENEPVVCRPVEGLDCFLRTKMDVLVLGDVVVRRAS